MSEKSNKGVGLCIFATKRYAMFLEGVVATARKYWKTTCPLSIVTFTDVLPPAWLSDVRIPTQHKQWPYVTLYRYRVLAEATDYLRHFQYLFMCDADMEFTGRIGDEVLGELVATIHSGHAGKPKDRLPFLRNRKSKANIPTGLGTTYYAGGFQGGKTDSFLSACKEMADAITADEQIGYIADWHDESHWNAFLARNPPDVTLPFTYCWGDVSNVGPDVKLLALHKPHSQMRKQ